MSQTIKSSGLLSIAILGSGNIVGTLISAIAIIIFSRFLGPLEFGLFSAAFAAMQILVRVADFGTNMASERAIARVHGTAGASAVNLTATALYLKLSLFLLCFGLTWVFAPWITHSFLHLENVGIIRLAAGLSVFTIFFEYSTAVFQSTHRFALVARITLAQAIGKLGFGLLLLWQNALSAVTALLIYGLMPGVGALLGWKKADLAVFALPREWRANLKTILSVAKWTGLAAIAATLADNVDTLLVQSLMTGYDTGIWSGAVRIATFVGIIGWSIGSVLNVRVARYRDPAHLSAYLSKAWKLALGVFFLLLLLIPLSSPAIYLTIGPAYLSGTQPLQILVLAAALAAATAPYVALFYLFDRPEYYAITGILQTVILVAGDLLLIPQYGLLGSAWVRVIVRLVVLAFTLLYARFAYKQHLAKR